MTCKVEGCGKSTDVLFCDFHQGAWETSGEMRRVEKGPDDECFYLRALADFAQRISKEETNTHPATPAVGQ